MRLPNVFLGGLLLAAACGASPGPATGSEVTFAHDEFLCTDAPTLEQMMRAYYARDTAGQDALFGSGRCWTEPQGTSALVLDHGQFNAQDGRQLYSLEVRLQSGSHTQQQGWTIVTNDGV